MMTDYQSDANRFQGLQDQSARDARYRSDLKTVADYYRVPVDDVLKRLRPPAGKGYGATLSDGRHVEIPSVRSLGAKPTISDPDLVALVVRHIEEQRKGSL